MVVGGGGGIFSRSSRYACYAWSDACMSHGDEISTQECSARAGTVIMLLNVGTGMAVLLDRASLLEMSIYK